MITEAELTKLPRLELRRKAMAAGLERSASAGMKNDALVEFIISNDDDATNGKSKKKMKPPTPVAKDEQAASDEEKPKRKVRKVGKAPASEGAVQARREVKDGLEEALETFTREMINRVDAIGTVVDKLVQASEAGFHAIDALQSDVSDIHKATLPIYNGTVDVASSYDNIEDDSSSD